MVSVALMIVALQVATAPVPIGIDADDPIVITAKRLADAEAALAACIKRRCPANEDMAASLRQTDAQFLAGKYFEARKTLAASRKRNKPYAKQYPVLTSELWRADSKLASLTGERRSSQISARAATDSLRAGLAGDDPRILAQRLDVGNSFAMGGEPDKALAIYAEVARRARAIGDQGTEGRAMLRGAIVEAAMARRDPLYVAVARRSLDGIAATGGGGFAAVREAAAVVRAKLDAFVGDASPDQIIAAMPRSTATTPVLIVAPPVRLGLPDACGRTTNDTRGAQFEVNLQCTNPMRISYDLDRQWVNIGYDVLPDGRVGNARAVEMGDKSVGDWAPRVIAAVEGRRFQPFAAPGDASFARLERYSLVSDVIATTGSRTRVRASTPHLEVVDLTGYDLAARR